MQSLINLSQQLYLMISQTPVLCNPSGIGEVQFKGMFIAAI